MKCFIKNYIFIIYVFGDRVHLLFDKRSFFVAFLSLSTCLILSVTFNANALEKQLANRRRTKFVVYHDSNNYQINDLNIF